MIPIIYDLAEAARISDSPKPIFVRSFETELSPV